MTLAETALSRWEAMEGLPFPLGSTRIEEESAYNFALYSKHAHSVTLLLYSEHDVIKTVFEYGVEEPVPNGRFEWHGLDRDKILLDPYAKSVFFHLAFGRIKAVRPGSSTGKTPLGVLAGDSEELDWKGDRRPRHEADTVIYESHVGGFTRNPNSGVANEACDAFAVLVEKIPYLKDLGVTVVEVMPVFQYDASDGNYWCYMPLNFFFPPPWPSQRPDGPGALNESPLPSLRYRVPARTVVVLVRDHGGG